MKKILLSIILISFLSACVETIVVGSVVTGRLAVREKTLKNTKEDIRISSQIIKKYSTSGLKIPGNAIDIMVNEKRVLLTGIVSNSSLASEAVDLAWKVDGVKEVIDEIQVARNRSRLNGFRTYSKDAIITGQIRARVGVNKDVNLLNVKINTVNSVVYLFGVSKSDHETHKLTKLVARIKGVKKVISHITLV